MAKYTYESLMSELKSGVYQPVYYLMGEEGYFTDRITDYIIDNALTESALADRGGASSLLGVERLIIK